MPRTSRTLLLSLGIVVVLGSVTVTAVAQSPADSAAASTKLVLGVSDPRDVPSQPLIDTFVASIADLSDGALSIEPVYDAGTVTPEGFELGVAGMVKRGEVDLGLVASRAWDLAGVTSLQALQAPFLITDDALAEAVAASDIATRAMSGLEDVGVHGLAMWPEDLRHPFSLIPGETYLSPDDFIGDAILVQRSAVSEMLIDALGATRFPDDDMNRSGAVADGLLHGAESGLRQGHSLAGTPTATGNVTFYPKFQMLVGNAEALAALSPDQQEIIRAAAAETQRQAIEQHPTEQEAAAAWCEAGRSIVLASEDQVAAFEAAAQPIFDQIATDPISTQLIDDIRSLRGNVEPAPGAEACGESVIGAPVASGSPTPPAGTEVTADAFDVPFTITIPTNWDLVIEQQGYVAINEPLPGGDGWPAIGIDVVVAESVIQDPCQPHLGAAAEVGPRPEDLAEWLASLEVLGATDTSKGTIAGRDAWVLDEGFVGSAGCPELYLWDNDGGFVAPQEHKRYYIFEAGGRRLVALVVAPDEDFDRRVDEALGVLDTLRFTDQ